ncbi:aromatic ring-hydroxylating oxygenase subunit alpha [Minwuia sp.]|uniref:aromatic ring-hydroxylating oxygenase subunit alpha n=1 Tax=Minwuia sp. TaxID=2493630 RepID=UPI003A930AA1
MDSGFSSARLSDDLTGRLRRVAARDNVTAALPNEAYVDPAFHRAEQDAVWRRHWIAIGFEGDVPRKGSTMPVDIAGLPLLLVRGRDDRVRVFHNICRHRGMKLVTEPGRTGSVIRCPYHAWCYKLDGALDRTPHVGGVGVNEHEAVHPGELGLVEVRAASWYGVVFADLSGEAPDVSVAFDELEARWREFDDAAFFAGGADSTFELTVNCNWKLAVENYLESYHLPSIHPGLNSYSRIEDHELVAGDNGNAGQVSLVYQAGLDPEGRGFPKVPGLSDYWSTRAEYIAVYPNLLYAIHADHWYGILLIPQSQEKTLERVRIGYFTEEAATGGAWADLRRANAALWRGVFEEDINPVERMQAGRHSPAFDGGVLTPVLETTTRDFHAWMAEKMLAG